MKPDPALLRSWDRPVVKALAAIAALPNFPPDQVRWGGFRFHGRGDGQLMDTVTLDAHSCRRAGFARLTATSRTFMITDHRRQLLTITALSDMIRISTGTAIDAVAILRRGLAQALANYNRAHTTPWSSPTVHDRFPPGGAPPTGLRR